MAQFGFNSTGNEVVERFDAQVKGKTILITGTSENGLGAETALSLARGQPSQLILLARSENKVDPVIAQIRQINAEIESIFVPVELDNISSVARAAEQIKSHSSVTKIDIVINNAGIMAAPYNKNDAGIESQLATNHIGHFYLTMKLQPLIAAAGKGARIVNLTSDGYLISGFRFDDYNFSDGTKYDPWSGYGQSKTANILFTQSLARNLAQAEVKAFAVHPGVITTTTLGRSITDPSQFEDIPEIAKRNTGVDFKIGQFKNAQQGVATTLVAALDPGLDDKSGSLLMDCNVVEMMSYASSMENAEKLWKLTENLVGEKWDLSKW